MISRKQEDEKLEGNVCEILDSYWLLDYSKNSDRKNHFALKLWKKLVSESKEKEKKSNCNKVICFSDQKSLIEKSDYNLPMPVTAILD